MSMVRFAVICDFCNRRSEEFTGWYTCRECGLDVCDDCAADGSCGDDETRKALCEACFDEMREET